LFGRQKTLCLYWPLGNRRHHRSEGTRFLRSLLCSPGNFSQIGWERDPRVVCCRNLMSIETAASVTAKITPVIKTPVTREVARSPKVRTKKRRVKSADKDRYPIVISRRRRRIVVSRRWRLGLRIGVRRGLRGRWWCLFTVSHVGLGDQATSQKDNHQKKTRFHTITKLV
jgi:hypothetical protein